MPFCNVLMLCGQGEDVVSHCILSVFDEPKAGGTFVVDRVPDVAQFAAKARRIHIENILYIYWEGTNIIKETCV